MRVENVKEVRKRLKALIEELHLSQTAFAKMVGLDASNLIKKLKGQIAITTNDMNAIRTSDLPINMEWLEIGVGSMFINDDATKTEYECEKSVGIPVFDQAFACGFDEFCDAGIMPVTYVDFPGTKNATLWCRATGDSMQPMIENGDYVCLKKIEDWQDFIVMGDVYAIDTFNDQRMIKRLQKGKTEDCYSAVSINELYEPQILPKEQIRNLFKVLGIAKIL